MLTMEETFIATGIFVLVVGVTLGLAIDWISKKHSERNKKDDK